MEATDRRSRLLATLDESICRDSDVEFVVAFGSRVSGPSRPSDIDLATKSADERSAHARFRKRWFLSGDLQRTDAPFVDVADIENPRSTRRTTPSTASFSAVTSTRSTGSSRRSNPRSRSDARTSGGTGGTSSSATPRMG